MPRSAWFVTCSSTNFFLQAWFRQGYAQVHGNMFMFCTFKYLYPNVWVYVPFKCRNEGVLYDHQVKACHRFISCRWSFQEITLTCLTLGWTFVSSLFTAPAVGWSSEVQAHYWTEETAARSWSHCRATQHCCRAVHTNQDWAQYVIWSLWSQLDRVWSISRYILCRHCNINFTIAISVQM